MEKRYYWLKLKEDFFRDLKIKKLRKIAGGDTYTIIYLKMQLLSLKNQGVLEYTKVENSFEEEIALAIDEDVENVAVTIAYLTQNGLLEEINESQFLLNGAVKCIGSETEVAARVRKCREMKDQNLNKELKTIETSQKEPKTNAQRQRMFRAKQICEEKQHIPLIEDYTNNKRYGGNYYIVFKRDKFKCSLCGSIENLCVHHIDGYDENKPQNNAENKLITLCRNCHSNVHAGVEIPKDILESINYFESNEMFPSNANVTNCNKNVTLDIDIEKDIELDIEKKEINKEKKLTDAQEIQKIIDDNFKYNNELYEAYNEFNKMRSKNKKVSNTPYANKKIINELNKMTDDDEEKIAIINQSIINGWGGIFPVKKNNYNNSYNNRPSTIAGASTSKSNFKVELPKMSDEELHKYDGMSDDDFNF